MKKKKYDADEEFKKIQIDFRLAVRDSMLAMSDHHEKTKHEGLPAGMGESLFFCIMWDEFLSIYEHFVPTEYEEHEDFLKLMFKKIMSGDGPPSTFQEKTKPIIN